MVMIIMLPENSDMRHSKEGGKVWLRWRKVKYMRTEATGERLRCSPTDRNIYQEDGLEFRENSD